MTVQLALVLAAAPPLLCVSPQGDDSADGSRSRPLRTLAKALEVSARSGAKTIELLPGVHVAEGLEIGPAHSGLTLQGADSGRTVVAAGPRLAAWQKAADGIWTHPWPSARPVRCLTRNGALVPRARFPHQGRFQHESVFDVRWMSTTGGGWERKPTEAELTTMTVKPGQIPADFKIQNAEVTAFHMWDESTIGVKAFDPETRRMTFTGSLGHPPGSFGVQDYVVWNTVEGLTPGTWMHDRSRGEILYRPARGQEPKPADDFRTATAEFALKIDRAERVTVRNIAFTTAGTPLSSGGFGSLNYLGVLTAEAAPNLTLQRVSVRGTGGWGIRTYDCPDLVIDRSGVRDAGAGGIRAEGARARIQDSTIQNTGLYYPSAPGLFIQGPGSTARHNLITDSTYSGIIGGSDDQVIEGNRIKRVMTVMHDGAAIYAGFASRMTYRGNWVSDIEDTGLYGSSAFYLDEGATDCLVEGNLSEGVGRPSQNHMAIRGTIRGNLFIIPADGRLEFARCTGFRLEDNLIQAQGSLTFRFSPGEVAFGRNAFHSGQNRFRFDALEPGGYATLRSEDLPESPGVLRGPLGLVLQRAGHHRAGPSGLTRTSGITPPDVSRAGPRPEPRPR
ncbi:MAG: right-handed parallel beta-helix repeat-containing protein [Fimbriimonadaceae bacterium]|nr:right-handed parallel beta-helix repeat-containing protein [Fimbriimonadaceae bacterium]